MPLAHQHLEKYGEFFPFGASMDLNGQITHAMASTGEERPPSSELISMLIEGFRSRSAKLRAAGVCSDVRLRAADGTAVDAIRVALEHADGEALDVFEPYRESGGWLTFDPLQAEPRQPAVFIDPRP